MITEEQQLEANLRLEALRLALAYPVVPGDPGDNSAVKDRADAFYKFLKPKTVSDGTSAQG